MNERDKPCPRCGSRILKVAFKNHDGGYFRVVCDRGHAWDCWSPTENDAWQIWNERDESTIREDERKKLRELWARLVTEIEVTDYGQPAYLRITGLTAYKELVAILDAKKE